MIKVLPLNHGLLSFLPTQCDLMQLAHDKFLSFIFNSFLTEEHVTLDYKPAYEIQFQRSQHYVGIQERNHCKRSKYLF